MSDVKHTPGPWKVSELHKEGLFGNNGEAFVSPVDDNEMRVAAIDCRTNFKRGEGWKHSCPERDANARLIAAAPELLDALQTMTAFAEGAIERVGLTDTNGIVAASRAIIARATGKDEA